MFTPDATFEIDFDENDDTPEAERRVLVHRAESLGFWMQYEDRLEALRGEESNRAATRGLIELIAGGLVGWRNLRDIGTGEPIDFDAENREAFARAFGPLESWTLATLIPVRATLSELEKKESRSRSPRSSTSSATGAAAPATATAAPA
ncbi:MAG: hypothetical protein ACF8PN_06780 [Phycisphaerales bacterium]